MKRIRLLISREGCAISWIMPPFYENWAVCSCILSCCFDDEHGGEGWAPSYFLLRNGAHNDAEMRIFCLLWQYVQVESN